MKKNYIILIILFLIFCISTSIAQNTTVNKITGSWMGKINAGAIPLRIIFNLSLNEKDSLVATLDSPDQGVKNIRIGPVAFSDNHLKISAPLLLGEYSGTLKNDTLIEGTWKQAGQTYDLELLKLRTAFSIIRPQEPKPPYPYVEKEVEFMNDKFNIRLAGTLTVPQGKGPFPAVIMITGSGAQNRNEEIMGHKPFMVIADWLTRNGIAVLRYDDRGVGKSQGNYAASTSIDLATDATAAFSYLKADPAINPGMIGFIGHSEGGLIAPIIASENKAVAFIVSLAGPGLPGDRIISRQSADISRVMGLSDEAIEESLAVNQKLFQILKKEPDNNKASEKMNAAYKEILEKKNTSPEESEKAIKQLQASLNPAALTWLRYFISTDPADFWRRVKCPVLALNGEKDLQVFAAENLPAIEKALKSSGNKSVKTMMLPGLNHLFQHCTTGAPSEYSSIEETFSPEALKIISDWISGLKIRMKN